MTNISVEDLAERTIIIRDIKQTLHGMTERERAVFTLRFGIEDGRSETLDDIAAMLGITRKEARSAESRAVRKLERLRRKYR